MGKLDGKVALITGGSSGIGLATAKLFAKEGAHIYITGRRPDKLKRAIEEIGSNVSGVQGDVANLTDLDRLFNQIKQEKGTLDIVFANAGASESMPVNEIDEGHFDRLFDSNVKGLVFTVQKALPLMLNGTAIVLCGSIIGMKGLPKHSIYAATKAAVRSFARTWTMDLKNRKIRVNVVSPGPIDTPGLRESIGDNDEGRQQQEKAMQTIPLGRMGEPDEVAKAVLFLASDDSSFITGVELFVDGGVAQV